MFTENAIVTAADGLHARPAADLVKLVKEYPDCVVSLQAGSRTVNAASMLSVLSLGLKKGTEVTVIASGPSDEAVGKALVSFIQSVK